MNIIVRPYGSEFCHCRPDTTWERENKDFYSPECVNEIWWTPVVFARVCKAGKCVGNKFVGRYYDGVGCGMLMYGAVSQPLTETRQALVSCIDRSSIFPMPLYNAVVMENEGNEYGVEIGGMTVPVIGTEGSMESGKAKDLLEETICKASELTSLRIGDFVAVELEGMKRLTSKEAGTTSVKGTFCENEIFNFNVIF